MTEWTGWAGTVLDVNLTTGKINREPLPRDMAVNHIGGSGFGIRVLYDELKPGIDPLGPDNIIIVTQGPLCGTLAPASGRYDIITKSPQTGIFLRTNGGGFFGPELKWAGYDMIVIRGRSEKPVYLWIDDDHVELRDASHLWGKDTWATQEIIQSELGDADIQTLKIGPSGENLGISSCVVGNLSRVAAKGAPGAVWGAKKLKAVAVRGSKGVKIARPQEFIKLCWELQERLKEDPTFEVQSRYGTPGWVSDPIMGLDWMGSGKPPSLLSSEFDKDIWDKNVACFVCPLRCSHFYTIKEGKYKGDYGEGFEANSIIYGGLIMGVDNRPFIAKYTTVCNQLGLHTDTPGCAIAWAMELYQDSIITREDTDGIELTWGNEEAILQMLHKIACREGFGDILDGYPLKAAEKLGRGSEKYASHVKGMTGRGSGVEGGIEWTLALAIATRGRDHLTGAPPLVHTIDLDGMREPTAKYGQEKYGDSRITTEHWYLSPEKARYVYDTENTNALCDMTGLCKFASEFISFTTGYHLDDFAAILSAATGTKFMPDDVLRAAEREMLLERAFNAREGIRRIDDHPIAFYWQLKYNEPHPRYKDTELPITLEMYDKMLDAYYRVRGCDLETGIPTREKLEEVGLEDVADDLARRGILPATKRQIKKAKRGER
jgi:aldehyde:ferredoxin oxidoreductase